MPIGPQYTSCVAPQNYKGYQIGPELAIGIPAIIAALATGNIPALVIAIGAVLSAFHEVVRWMLHGKLICLPNAEDRCVIGTVANIEEVGQDKFLIAKIDNDYSINLILQPFNIDDYLGDQQAPNQEKARAGPQGDFLKVQPGMPPDDESGGPKYGGYFSTWIRNNHTGGFHVYEGEFESDEIKEWVEDNQDTFGKWWSYTTYRLPVIHCECEGSRIRDVLDALESYPGGGSKFCKANPFTKFLCKVVATLLAPYVIAKVIYAWAAASGGDADDARLDPESGEIEVGDTLLIRGRWVYDAAHSGYNEIHAVRSIQKLLPKHQGMQIPPADFAALHARMCGLVSAVPPVARPAPAPGGGSGPPPPPPPPPVIPPMTPEQEEVFDRQRMPENRWYFHPALDACEPVGGKP